MISSRLPPAALFLVMTFLSGCAQGISSACPPWPVAGPAVAGELGKLPKEDYPATWEWMGRLGTLHDQLKACGG